LSGEWRRDACFRFVNLVVGFISKSAQELSSFPKRARPAAILRVPLTSNTHRIDYSRVVTRRSTRSTERMESDSEAVFDVILKYEFAE
jgi:hypothetical protein